MTMPVTPNALAGARQTGNNTKTTILSVDLGRTATKASISRDPNQVVLVPANLAERPVEQIRGTDFEPRVTNPLLDMWLEHQGRGYAVGHLAADLGANLGVGQSKLEDALVKVLACVGYFDVKDDVSVVLGLPFHTQQQFDQEKEQLINLLSSPHVMSYRGETVSINVQKVWVMPEGYGSLIWCEAQEETGKKASAPRFSDAPVAIVDIGHQTTDFLMVDSFRFARGISKSEAFAMSQFYEQVAAQIEGADSESLSLLEAVNRPHGERFFRPRGATRPINLDDFLPNLREQFARDISNRLMEWLPERVTDVILTGGGGEFFWSDIQRLLKEAKLTSHLAQPSRQANVLGQYIYGEAQSVSTNRSTKS